MSIFSRIESCRKLGESTTALCKRMGIQYRQYMDIKNSGARPTQRSLDKMALGLKVSRLWLETGEGPKTQAEYERMLKQWESNGKKGSTASRSKKGRAACQAIS